MSSNRIYTVKSGDCAWNFAKDSLKRQNIENINDTAIANEMNRLAKEYNCTDSIEFNKKYFNKIGREIELKQDSTSEPQAIPNTLVSENECRKIESDSIFIDSIFTRDSLGKNILKENIEYHFKKPNEKTESWKTYQQAQDKINNLPTDKEKIIEWNKQFNKDNDQNYVIVDKQNFTATIYSPNGEVIKEYEIGCAKNKSDALLKRSKKNKNNNFAATSAGIYTANYRATGRDAYAKLYNDRVLTLSNDGLREKGVGNGETGVAFHQVPNGNKRRIELLKKPGACEENNRFSDGCINFLPEDFDDLMGNIKGVGTKVYVLPEDSNNYMCVKNGKLHFAQKEYTGDVATTTSKNDPVKRIKINVQNSSFREEASQMAKTLSDKKLKLAQDLGIDNDTYNELSMMTLGIAGRETEFGKPLANFKKGPYWLKENMPFLVNIAKRWTGDNSFNSRGLTQIKLKSYTDQNVKDLMKKYGINEDNLGDGDKSAIATMIVLSSIYKNELPALKKQMQDLDISKYDAVLYCWNGKKKEITEGTATPDISIYHNQVKRYMNDFDIQQCA